MGPSERLIRHHRVALGNDFVGFEEQVWEPCPDRVEVLFVRLASANAPADLFGVDVEDHVLGETVVERILVPAVPDVKDLFRCSFVHIPSLVCFRHGWISRGECYSPGSSSTPSSCRRPNMSF